MTNADPGGEVFDVKAYGARGDGTNDDTAAIQKAIDAATAGGIVFFPPGKFSIRDPGLVLPRQIPLALVGSGPGASSLDAMSGALTSTTPLVRWTPDAKQQTGFFRMEALALGRSDDGPVLVYDMPTDDVVIERLVLGVFRHLYFRSAGTTASSAQAVRISGALSCHFEDISVFGGAPGFVLAKSSHCLIQNFRSDIDSCLYSGICIDGGGSHVLTEVRIEATTGGPGVQLKGGAANIQIQGAYFEGKRTNPQIDVEDAHTITILHPALAFPGVENVTGLQISGAARNVRVIGGVAGDFTMADGSKAIRVLDGAMRVLVEGLAFDNPSRPSSNPAGNVEIDPGATGVKIQVYDAKAGYTESVFTSAS